MNSKYMWILLAALLPGLVLLNACSDDDNPASSDDGHHMDAVGVAFVMDGDTLVKVTSADVADVVGELEVHEGETLGPILVHFLDDEGNWFRPEHEEDADHSLELRYSSLVASITVDEAEWSFTVEGVEADSSALRVAIIHGDHDDYLSPEIPLIVSHSEGYHTEPVGLYLLADQDTVVVCHANDTVTANLVVPVAGLELECWFFDESAVSFQPEADHNLGITLEDGSLLSVGVDGWNLSLASTGSGTDNMEISLNHGDHSHYTSPQIPVVME